MKRQYIEHKINVDLGGPSEAEIRILQGILAAYCSSVTGAALDQLRTIRVLDLYGCDTSKINLRDILSLSMNGSLRSVRLPDGSLYRVIPDLIFKIGDV